MASTTVNMEKYHSYLDKLEQRKQATQQPSPDPETDIEYQLRVNDPSIAAYPHLDSRHHVIGPYRLPRENPEPIDGEEFQRQYQNRSQWLCYEPEVLEELRMNGSWSPGDCRAENLDTRALSVSMINTVNPESLNQATQQWQPQSPSNSGVPFATDSAHRPITPWTGFIASPHPHATIVAQGPTAQQIHEYPIPSIIHYGGLAAPHPISYPLIPVGNVDGSVYYHQMANNSISQHHKLADQASGTTSSSPQIQFNGSIKNENPAAQIPVKGHNYPLQDQGHATPGRDYAQAQEYPWEDQMYVFPASQEFPSHYGGQSAYHLGVPRNSAAATQDVPTRYSPKPYDLLTPPVGSGSASPQIPLFGQGHYGHVGASYGIQYPRAVQAYGGANTDAMPTYGDYHGSTAIRTESFVPDASFTTLTSSHNHYPSYGSSRNYGSPTPPVSRGSDGQDTQNFANGQTGYQSYQQSSTNRITRSAGGNPPYGSHGGVTNVHRVDASGLYNSDVVREARVALAASTASNSISGRSGNKPKQNDPKVRQIPAEAYGPPHPPGQYPKAVTDVLGFPGQACTTPGCNKHKRDHWPIMGFGDLECCALKCEICGWEFTATSSVRRHLRAKHTFSSEDSKYRKIYDDVLMANGIPFEQVVHEKKIKGAAVRTKSVDYAAKKRKASTQEDDAIASDLQTGKIIKKTKSKKQ